TSVALWTDALLAYAYAYDKLIVSQLRLGVELIRPNISCTDGRGWPLAIELYSKFNQLGIAILFKLPIPEKLGLFSISNSLALEIWIYTFAAVFTVSFILLLIARCSPDEW
ncbi:unnamed protein product, partial [Rotaria sp. Silwood2]